MQMSELFGRIRTIGDKTPKPDVLPPSDGDDKGKAAKVGK